MKNREPVQQRLSKGRQPDQNFAMIFIAGSALQGSAFDQSINQLYRTVMPKTQLLRDRRHRRTCAAGETLDGKQKLVLLRFNSLGTGGIFAEVQEFPDTVTELGQLAKAKFGYIRSR